MSKKGGWEAYIEDYREVFNLYDKNGDGKIQTGEIQEFMRRLGQNPSDKEALEIMRNMDTNRDGHVSIEEFAKMMHERPEANEQELIKAFAVFDQNGDGFLNAAELRHTLTTMGEQMTNREVDDILKVVDINGDGKIDYQEFVAMMSDK